MAEKNSPGTLPFADSFELVKRIWGMAGLPTMPGPTAMAQFAQRLPQSLPSMVAPTLDVNELDKRIADLRAVEQWLNLNVGMLRTTIQSLEVQRNTIATLRSFGGTMLSAAAAGAREAANSLPTMSETPKTEWPAALPPEEPPPAAPRKRKAKRKASAEEADSSAAMPFNPVAWWGNLQEQFNKVAAAAAEAPAPTGGKAASTGSKPAPAKRPSRKRKTETTDE
jgi:hypothetical protein